VQRPESLEDENETIAAAQRGDESAFAELYRRYARMVHGILLARAPAAEVDDLVQDVFIQMWRKLGSLRDPAAFPGWLGQIARHRAIDHFRSRMEVVELSANAAATPAPPRDEAAEAMEAIRSMPEAYRETLVLRLVEGMSGDEIAARTGLTPASVRVNLHRGMKMLRERLGR
jgi:RNA polymerase sigma-70 factor (ECF subfamily)